MLPGALDKVSGVFLNSWTSGLMELSDSELVRLGTFTGCLLSFAHQSLEKV